MKSGLVSDVDHLLADQIARWPLLTRGIAGLRASQTRVERVAGHDLFVRHIPHRIVSTTAAVDAVSIAKRPCFLCPSNLPREEHGIPFDSKFAIYCNPFPILERHLTIVHVDHRPQCIKGSFESMLRLAEGLPDSFILYNGPRCGASAPDHMHFQACSRELFPIEHDARGVTGPSFPNYGRRVFVFRERSISPLAERLQALMDILQDVTRSNGEPMVNIAAYYDQGQWTSFVFPRGKHRPRAYETGERTVSPATIDLCGVLVVPVERDFMEIRGPEIEGIFEEVTLPELEFEKALGRL
jgi:Domain of unknown function (DUF4922)